MSNYAVERGFLILKADKPEKIHQLAASNRELKNVKELGRLTSLTSLNLAFNDIASLSYLETCPHIEYLNVNHNKLTSLVGLGKKRIATKNRLPSIKGESESSSKPEPPTTPKLPPLSRPASAITTALRVLRCSHNQISSLQELTCCIMLEELWVQNNKISDLSEFNSIKTLPRLKVLVVKPNNCCRTTPHDFYQHFIIDAMTHLTSLDGTAVTDHTRELAREMLQSDVGHKALALTVGKSTSKPRQGSRKRASSRQKNNKSNTNKTNKTNKTRDVNVDGRKPSKHPIMQLRNAAGTEAKRPHSNPVTTSTPRKKGFPVPRPSSVSGRLSGVTNKSTPRGKQGKEELSEKEQEKERDRTKRKQARRLKKKKQDFANAVSGLSSDTPLGGKRNKKQASITVSEKTKEFKISYKGGGCEDPTAVLMRPDGSGYARWPHDGHICITLDRNKSEERLFAMYTGVPPSGGSIAALFDGQKNGTINYADSKTCLSYNHKTGGMLMNENGFSVLTWDETGKVTSCTDSSLYRKRDKTISMRLDANHAFRYCIATSQLDWYFSCKGVLHRFHHGYALLDPNFLEHQICFEDENREAILKRDKRVKKQANAKGSSNATNETAKPSRLSAFAAATANIIDFDALEKRLAQGKITKQEPEHKKEPTEPKAGAGFGDNDGHETPWVDENKDEDVDNSSDSEAEHLAEELGQAKAAAAAALEVAAASEAAATAFAAAQSRIASLNVGEPEVVEKKPEPEIAEASERSCNENKTAEVNKKTSENDNATPRISCDTEQVSWGITEEEPAVIEEDGAVYV